MAKNGRPPADRVRDLKIYMAVEDARKMQRPKHPGLEPVPLSWDKAYEVAQWTLERDWRINLSTGAIRAAYARCKKFIGQIESFRIRGVRYTRKKSAKNP
jgi:hypothetical protein